jgi:hypothetical protein
MIGMGTVYPDLPEWEFVVEEFTKGGYRVRAIRSGGVTGEATGVDPARMLSDLREWAAQVETDLSRRRP